MKTAENKHSDGDCPPGFWMTELEILVWQAMAPRNRRTYERQVSRRLATKAGGAK